MYRIDRHRCKLRLQRRHIDAVARLRTGHLLGECGGEFGFAAAAMRQRQKRHHRFAAHCLT